MFGTKLHDQQIIIAGLLPNKIYIRLKLSVIHLLHQQYVIKIHKILKKNRHHQSNQENILSPLCDIDKFELSAILPLAAAHPDGTFSYDNVTRISTIKHCPTVWRIKNRLDSLKLVWIPFERFKRKPIDKKTNQKENQSKREPIDKKIPPRLWKTWSN